ncbi:MAG: thiamine diphosphokinase [Clostridiales bacterium]|nr:thiamine diphosphokinase [Clostridiales bacterium]
MDDLFGALIRLKPLLRRAFSLVPKPFTLTQPSIGGILSLSGGMHMATCYIVGAGEFTPRELEPAQGDLVIAADGGYAFLQRLGIVPDILLGDFDSLGEPPALPDGVELIRHPVRKDDTDTGLALAVGYQRGYRDFALYGCGGGRIDHLLANFQSMARYAKAGAAVRLVDEAYLVYALHNGTLTLPPRPVGTLISVFCHGDTARGVTLRGLSYLLDNAELSCDVPLGVSNAYTGESASVTVGEGTLLVIITEHP